MSHAYPTGMTQRDHDLYMGMHPNGKWPSELAEPTEAEQRTDLSDAFKYALIRKQYVNWGAGFCASESAADVLYNASTHETDEVWRDLQATIANGASDADVAALARHWHRLALSNAVDTLVVCAQQGQHITFPSTVR